MSGSPTLLVIAGPTAVGKTEYSLRLAHHTKAPIISADSRQVFRELQIGTARIEDHEMEGIPHFLIGHIGLDQEYNAGIYEKEALNTLSSLFKNHPYIVMVGGTGLYIKAVISGLDKFPEVPVEYRSRRERQLLTDGIESLSRDLARLDPAYAEKVDMNNPARLIRALSVCDASGRSYTSFLKGSNTERPFHIKAAWLNLPRTELYSRIDERVDRMMEKGLLDEVRKVMPYKGKQALQSVGYRELIDHLEGNCSLDRAVELIKTHTRQYAKRQITWFKKYIPGPELDVRDTESIDRYYLET